jgi:hypothetical protein
MEKGECNMNKTLENSAKAPVGGRISKGFRFSWLLYAAAAYFGVRYLYKKGILPKQTGAALDFMNKGVDYAKNQIGMSPSTPQSQFKSPRLEDTPNVHH